MAISDARDLYAEPYDWNDLSTSGKLYSYSQGGGVVSQAGVDVSEHQGDIDWDKFAEQGVQFAYLRIGYRSTDIGAIAKDAKFDQNLSGARAAGLRIGVYFFSQAIDEDEAREEADFVCDTLGDTVLDYPVAFDLEPSQANSQQTLRIDGLTNDQLTSIAQAFCERVEERGHKAIIYGNQFDLNHFDLDKLRQYGFWYAEYDSAPSSPLSFGIWQYSATAELDGCGEKVDLNLDLTSALSSALQSRDSAESEE